MVKATYSVVTDGDDIWSLGSCASVSRKSGSDVVLIVRPHGRIVCQVDRVRTTNYSQRELSPGISPEGQ